VWLSALVSLTPTLSGFKALPCFSKRLCYNVLRFPRSGPPEAGSPTSQYYQSTKTSAPNTGSLCIRSPLNFLSPSSSPRRRFPRRPGPFQHGTFGYLKSVERRIPRFLRTSMPLPRSSTPVSSNCPRHAAPSSPHLDSEDTNVAVIFEAQSRGFGTAATLHEHVTMPYARPRFRLWLPFAGWASNHWIPSKSFRSYISFPFPGLPWRDPKIPEQRTHFAG